MSDFDKEAEREKLRKQFEEDEEKRENTERMSELLLQGATMTNSHCDTCGDPIFRYDGQEFCPTCQVEVTDNGETAQPETEQQQTQQAQQSPDSASASPSESDATNIEIGTEQTESSVANAPGATNNNLETAKDPQPSKSPEPEPQTEPVSRLEPSSQSIGGLSDARQSLIRTVTRFAQQAETADDLRHAREFLAATEDAAEALEALNRAEK